MHKRELKDGSDVVSTRMSLPGHVERWLGSPTWSGRLARGIGLLLPLLGFYGVVHVEWPVRLLHAAADSVIFTAGLAAPLLYIVIRRQTRLGTLAAWSLMLCLFALPLLALWHHRVYHYSVIGGLLPWSDASGYYYDARRLLDGHLLDWSARRPLFVGLLATLLAITNENLQLVLMILVAVHATACALFGREVQRSHGPAAAVIAVMILFFFYREAGGVGLTLTESLGFPLGILGFAIVWQGMREQRAALTWMGLTVLTVALMARAGAFFVLPALVLGTARAFRGDKRRVVRFTGGALAAIALGVVLNMAVARALTSPATRQSAFSNFSHVFYGLAVGGKGWRQVLIDHPDAKEGGEMYRLAFEAVRNNPSRLLLGTLRMWREYLPGRPHHALAFVNDRHARAGVQWTCYLLLVVGLLCSFVTRHDPIHFAIVAAATGQLASIPFAPSIDGGVRVYAATMPIIAVLIGIGGAAVLRAGYALKERTWSLSALTAASVEQAATTRWPHASVVCAASIVACATAGPVLVRAVGRPPTFVERSCPPGQLAMYVRLRTGTFLRIVNDPSQERRLVVPAIGLRELRRSPGLSELSREPHQVESGHTLINTQDLKTGRLIWLHAPTHLLPVPPAVLSICGRYSRSSRYGLFDADSVEIATGPAR